MSAATLGVDDSFWDSLSVEMCNQVDKVEVLQEKWSVLTSSLCLVSIWILACLVARKEVALREGLRSTV